MFKDQPIPERGILTAAQYTCAPCTQKIIMEVSLITARDENREPTEPVWRTATDVDTPLLSLQPTGIPKEDVEYGPSLTKHPRCRILKFGSLHGVDAAEAETVLAPASPGRQPHSVQLPFEMCVMLPLDARVTHTFVEYSIPRQVEAGDVSITVAGSESLTSVRTRWEDSVS